MLPAAARGPDYPRSAAATHASASSGETPSCQRRAREGSVAAACLDEPVALELPVAPRHGVRGEAEVVGEAAHGRQLRAGRELAARHLLDELQPQLFERRGGRLRVDGEHQAPAS
jgi:hypothetical protein